MSGHVELVLPTLTSPPIELSPITYVLSGKPGEAASRDLGAAPVWLGRPGRPDRIKAMAGSRAC